MLVKKEIEYYVEECNFTEDEEKFFRWRCQNKTWSEIVDLFGDLDMCRVRKCAKCVREKIRAVGIIDRLKDSKQFYH